jgi:hypothetical protein
MSGSTTPTIAQTAAKFLTTGIAVGTIGVGISAISATMNGAAALANAMNDNVTFPSDLISAGGRNHYIDFKFQKYEKRSVSQQTFDRFDGNIKLPLPNSLHDNMSVSYSDADLSPVVGAVTEQLARERPSSAEDVQGRFNSLTAQIGEGVGDIASAAGVQATFGAAATMATGGAAVLSNLTGTSINPFQTVLFERPAFKTHQFSWRLIPRSEQESGIIKDIIKMFQYHMLPGITDASALLFTYPETVRITLYPSDEFLYRFKPCVIENVSVNYAPGVSPAFYRRSNAPVAVDITIQLKEIEYWTKRDILKPNLSSASSPVLPNFGGG